MRSVNPCLLAMPRMAGNVFHVQSFVIITLISAFIGHITMKPSLILEVFDSLFQIPSHQNLPKR